MRSRKKQLGRLAFDADAHSHGHHVLFALAVQIPRIRGMWLKVWAKGKRLLF